MSQNEKWYYNINGQARGPVEKQQIIELISQGTLKLSDLVFREGSDKWIPLSECEGVEKRKGSAPPDIHHYISVPQSLGSNETPWILLIRMVTSAETRFLQS